MLQVGTEWVSVIISISIRSSSSSSMKSIKIIIVVQVCKTQNTNSCEVSTGSIIKNIYGRLFRYIVDMCNNTLIVSPPHPIPLLSIES